MHDLYTQFQNPGAAFRGKPFWAWNGLLNEAELRRQIRVMHQMGLGGFFMHSRVGLATPYLSPEWMQLVHACIDEARQLKMEAWLYDEDRWPSGAAGGLVTRDPQYRQKYLMLTISRNPVPWEEKVLGVWTGRVQADQVFDLQVVPRHHAFPKIEAGESYLIFTLETSANDPWYNGYTYLDTLSHAAVKKYLEVTHEAYRQNIGAYFGNLVPGIFTDEPNHGATNSERFVAENGDVLEKIPWTPELPGIFRQRYGYDILEHLPALFLDVDGETVSQARYHYHDCKTFLFVDAFARQIGEWCGQNQLLFTGHVLEEPTPASQTNYIGSAMRCYEYMQAPGIDILTEGNREYDTAKQTASVLRQTGRKWLLSELYGCTGWDFNFESHKAVGDWQAALGVNLRCQHLYWYTMAGEAKRDYPASIAHQSPWWQEYAQVEDYFARIGVVLTQGQPRRDLLVIHPLESTWLRCRTRFRQQADVNQLDQKLEQLRDWLLAAAIDFDYGDEEMLGRFARIEKSPAGAIFHVGQAAYRVLLVPETLTLRQTTVHWLQSFHEAGGKVIFVGAPAEYVEALPSPMVSQLAMQCQSVPFTEAAIVKAVNPARIIAITQADGQPFRTNLLMLREDDLRYYLFVVNTDRQQGYPGVQLTVPFPGRVEEWDPATGARYLADFQALDAKLQIRTDLPASGSRLFIIQKSGSQLTQRRPHWKIQTRQELDLATQPILLNEPNVVVLDRPAFRLAEGDWQSPLEILKVDQAARDYLQLERRGGRMVQPWARAHEPTGPQCPLELKYVIHVQELPSQPLALALEQPERYTITVNGQRLAPETEYGWWVDPSLRLLPIDPTSLHSGENQVVLQGIFDPEANLEASFLLGEFGVDLADGLTPVLTRRPTHLKPGDWVSQGLPFYAGVITYQTQFTLTQPESGHYFLEIPKFKGGCVKLIVNGQQAGIIAWQPYELDITEFVQPGENQVQVQLISSRRNSHGPLHQTSPEPPWTGPENFITTGARWQEAYHLKPVGILQAPQLTVRRVE